MRVISQKLALFLFTTIVLASSAFFIPSFVRGGQSVSVCIAIIASVTLLGAVRYFLDRLASFKRELKVAYYLLTLGMVLYGLLPLQLFLIIFAGLNSPVIQGLLVLIPYGLASLLAYLGMRKFARLLEARNVWTSLRFVIGVAVVAAALASRAPLPSALAREGVQQATFGILMAMLAWNVALSVSAGIAALNVRKVINPLYKPAMIWTAVALFSLAFGSLHGMTIKPYFADSAYVSSSYSTWPFILTGILFLGAGLAFRATQLYGLQLQEDASYIDVITSLASLVSKPAAVDKELDGLRAITAQGDSAKLTQRDQAALLGIYLYLEEYLTTREPLTKFNKETLRESLPKRFTADLNYYERTKDRMRPKRVAMMAR